MTVKSVWFWILLFLRVLWFGGDNVDHIYARENPDGVYPDGGRAIRAAIVLNDILCAVGFGLTAASIIAASQDLFVVTMALGIPAAYLDWRTIRRKSRLGRRVEPKSLTQRLANFIGADISD